MANSATHSSFAIRISSFAPPLAPHRPRCHYTHVHSVELPMAAPLHLPVLLPEILAWCAPRPGMILFYGTLGGCRHARLLAEQLGGQGFVLALDRDPAAL